MLYTFICQIHNVRFRATHWSYHSLVISHRYIWRNLGIACRTLYLQPTNGVPPWLLWWLWRYCTFNIDGIQSGNQITSAGYQFISTLNPNYIFILYLTPSFNGLDKDSCKTRRETLSFGDLVRLILEVWRCGRQIKSLLLIWLHGTSCKDIRIDID